ncbi:MAG: LuxR C-terminal-related transcriptional regulator [Balneolaceae bacterium]
MDQRVLVVGENRLSNEALQFALSAKGFNVTLENNNFSKVQSHIRKTDPDYVIWDNSIVGFDFNRILSISKSFLSSGNSIVILNSQMLHYMAEGLMNGIYGFIHIKSSISELNHCLNTLEEGVIYISKFLIGDQHGFSGRELPFSRNNRFTPRELEILRYIKLKKSSREIANILNISIRTVQNIRQNLCNKLGLSGRGALYRYSILYFNSNMPDKEQAFTL